MTIISQDILAHVEKFLSEILDKILFLTKIRKYCYFFYVSRINSMPQLTIAYVTKNLRTISFLKEDSLCQNSS